MRERGHGLGLPLETRETARVVCEEVGEHFDRDITIQLRVARPIDLAHSTFADLGDDGIRPDLDIAADLRARIDNCRRMNFHSTPASLKLK